jgi:O-acetyl-ADP-ribose deacetylase (regulator of RNase III)
MNSTPTLEQSVVKYVTGDLFDTDRDIIAHGCNCKGVMGSGVARIVREKYPKAYSAYCEQHEQDGLWLGEIQTVLQYDGKYIANCMTQNGFMPRTVCHADYKAIETCMWKLKKFAKEKGLSIAIPKIGAGLAGGDWNTIEGILNKVFSDYDITVYCL